MRALARKLLPSRARSWLHSRGGRFRGVVRALDGGPRHPPIGWVRFGTLRRLTPVSRDWGYDRGQPIDRYYIETFLERHASDVRGRVLEVQEDHYTRRFGGSRVLRSDVLHVTEGNPLATIVADLTSADHIPSDAFDCVILTQTLQLIYDVGAALRTLHRIVKPGGVLLATVPGITAIEDAAWGDRWCWSFTPLSARKLVESAFPEGEVRVEAHGNVLSSAAFLYGLAVEELHPNELDHDDPAFPLVIAVRAVKETTC